MLGLRGSIDSLLVGLCCIFIFLTTCGQALAGIMVIIFVAIVEIFIIVTSTIAALVIASAAVAISSVNSPIVYIIIVAAYIAVPVKFSM